MRAGVAERLTMEDDTHCAMTYTICRTVGFSHAHAFIVAMANVAVDDLDSTVAAGTTNGSFSTVQPHVDAQWMWHAIAPSDALWAPLQDTHAILKQKNLLFQLALDKWLGRDLDRADLETWTPTGREAGSQRTQQLKWLGVFFHYQMDSWAHRRQLPNRNTRKDWESYQTPFGHVDLKSASAALWDAIRLTSDPFKIAKLIYDGVEAWKTTTIHHPDRPPWNPIGALRNLEDGIIYAATFLKHVLGKEPNPHFVNFEITPWNDRVDQTWPARKERFNQLSRAAKTDAGKYLEALIRAQIDAYTSDGRDANEADASKVLDALGKVWDEYRDKLQLGSGGQHPDPFYRSSQFPAKKAERDSTNPPISTMIEGTNQLVAKMGAWQDVLGFPTAHKAYLDLYPNHPQADPMLEQLTGPWESHGKNPDRERDVLDRLMGPPSGAPGGSYNGAPVVAVTPLPRSKSSLGLSKNGVLLYKSASDAPWKRAPNSNAFDSTERDTCALANIAVSANGVLVGRRRNTDEFLFKTPGPVWFYPDPDALPPTWTGMLKSDGSTVGGGPIIS